MRFVIKAPSGAYFTEFDVKETRAVTLKGVLVGYEQDLVAKFEGQKPKHGAKFDTEQDALDQIANKELFHGGPDAFAGCTVVSTED